MITDKLIGKALGRTDLSISIDRSRCMRMRFNLNECPVCTSNCHSGAITIDDDIAIDTDKCTLCMVCVSECPADCFDFKGGAFFGIMARLRRLRNSVPWPVLGCSLSPDNAAHERTVCLGVLSDEYLIALNTFMERPVQLNLTACEQCDNSFIVDKLKAQIADIRENTGIDVTGKVFLVENKADLNFDELSYDRRGFFSAIKEMTVHGASALIMDDAEDVIQCYSQKSLPLKRTVLNKIIETGTDIDIASRVLKEYAFTVKANASCDNCVSCIGVCPTGALKGGSGESGAGLLFNPSMCIGCALCRDFCFNKSITLMHGYSGEKYFEHAICTKDSL